MSNTKTLIFESLRMCINKTHLLFFVSLLIFFGLSCNNNDPVSAKNNNNQGGNTGDVGTVTDIDGNVYHTIQIGNQVWTVEDLRTTRFRDGTKIPLVTDITAWKTLSTPGYCYYNNTADKDSIKKFGALYNWYAVNTKKLAPAGWRVPDTADWKILEDYLISHGYNWDGTTTGNKIAKSLASNSDWKTSTTSGTVGNNLSSNNKSKFSGLPDGLRYGDGNFSDLGDNVHWWSTNGYDSLALSYYLRSSMENSVRHSHLRRSGLSVRLVKGN